MKSSLRSLQQYFIHRDDDRMIMKASCLRMERLTSSDGGGGGGSGGAKVLGKLSVPGRPTSLDDSRARAYCACSRCG